MGVIEDGKGTGKKVQIDDGNRMLVRAYSESIQHSISHDDGQAYQIIGTATLASGTVVPLHITNTSSTYDMIITYLRHQIVGSSGGTAFATTDNNYFQISLGATYSSGGSSATAVQLNSGTANTAEITAYESNPTLITTNLKEIDRWYTKADGDMNSFSKEGSIVLTQNGTMSLSYIGDQTSGTIYTRVSFVMMEKHGL